MEWATKLNWYNPATFQLTDYEHYEKVENGDINWIIPGRMLGFCTPVDSSKGEEGALSPEEYVPIFQKLGVTMVVRLTTKEYDREVFLRNGFKHIDLYFPDGQAPPDVLGLRAAVLRKSYSRSWPSASGSLARSQFIARPDSVERGH